MPSFIQLLERTAELWETQRDEVIGDGSRLSAAFVQSRRRIAPQNEPKRSGKPRSGSRAQDGGVRDAQTGAISWQEAGSRISSPRNGFMKDRG